MVDVKSQIDAALSSHDTIPREKVLSWIQSTNSLAELAKLYKLTGEGYSRIQPELGKTATCSLIERYLLECIRQDIGHDDEVYGRWEAADVLHIWLRRLLETGEASQEIDGVARAVTHLFLTSDGGVRIAIEQGFLEHALETDGLRPYFEHWSKDSRLRESWKNAIEWANDHPDYTWNLRQEFLRKIKGK
jgi:hypothetical protein